MLKISMIKTIKYKYNTTESQEKGGGDGNI